METTLSNRTTELAEPQSKALLPSLTGSVNAIRQAITEGLKFTHLPTRSKGAVVSQAYIISGLKEPDETNFDLFATTINERYRWITDKEIIQAFKMNAFGDLKETVEFFGIITVANLCKVMNQFEVKRNPVKLELEVSAQILEKSDEEKAELTNQWLDDIRKAFSNYKGTGVMPKDPICAAMWDSLFRRGKIVITEEQKENYYQEALTDLIKEKSESMDRNEVQLARKAAEGNTPSILQSEAKTRAKKTHLCDLWISLQTISI